MKPMTKQELYEAIRDTEQQEKLFRLAGDNLMTASWILIRVQLRAQLYQLLKQEAFRL